MIKLILLIGILLTMPEMAQARIQEMTDALNQMRRNYGLGQLYWDDSLMGAAYVHARDMSHNGYCDHGGLFDRVYDHGWQGGGYGEIVTCGIDGVWDSVWTWMNSPGHKNILLNPFYNHLGVAHYYGRAGHRWAVIIGFR